MRKERNPEIEGLGQRSIISGRWFHGFLNWEEKINPMMDWKYFYLFYLYLELFVKICFEWKNHVLFKFNFIPIVFNMFLFLHGFSLTNFHDSQVSRGKGRLSLTPLYYFHPLHRHLDISSPLYRQLTSADK